MCLSVLMMNLTAYMNSAAVTKKISLLHTYQDFYTLAAARYKFDVALAGVLFLAWIKVSTCTFSTLLTYDLSVDERSRRRGPSETKCMSPARYEIAWLDNDEKTMYIGMSIKIKCR